MKRPLAYITAVWNNDDGDQTIQAARYCRLVYEAGYSPICPILFMPYFINSNIPEDHKNGADIKRDLLRRAHVLVLCGRGANEEVKDDIAVAARLGIMSTTLDGILTVKSQGRPKTRV